MSKVAQFFVGIDLHAIVVQICVLNAAGEVVRQKRWRCRDRVQGQQVIEFLKRWRQDGRYVVEAIGLNRWFVNACLAEGFDIVVADPRKLGLKNSGKKTDRRDALELARRLRLGDIDRHARTYYPSEQEYGQRKLLRTRTALKEQRLLVENHIRALLRAYKQDPLPGQLSSGPNLGRLKRLQWTTPELELCLASWVEMLETVAGQIRILDRRIKELSQEPLPRLLQKWLPSVGPLTSLGLLAEVGDWRRFKNRRAVAKYPGLVPRVAQSGDRSHNGRLVKAGNRQLRWLLGQWAVRLLARNALVQEWARRRMKRLHKNKIRTALARKLLVGVYVMLTRGEVFSLRKCLAG
jgi:transposase